MDSVKQLQRQYVRFVKSLYREGTLGRQFICLQKMQDVEEQFLMDTINHFFDTSERRLHSLNKAIEEKLVGSEVKENVHRIKGGSMSLGVRKLDDLCLSFKDQYDTGNHEKCLKLISQIKEEYYLVKNKLQEVLSLQQQIIAAGGSIPVLK